MRVLFNGLQAGNRSGTGRCVAELARRLPGLADDVEVAVLWPRHVPLAPDAEDACVLVDSRSPLQRLWHDQFGVRALRRRMEAGVVHFPANVGPLLAMDGAVLTVHDLSFLRGPQWYRPDRAAYYRYAVRRSARLAARVIVDSQATAADVVELLGVPEDRIDVVPLGVGDEFRCGCHAQAPSLGVRGQDGPGHAQTEFGRGTQPRLQTGVRERYRLPERFFLFVGTLEPRKNLVRLIDAFTRIAPGCEHDLVLAGRDGWKVAPIRAAAAASPQARRIHFPGFVADEDLPAVLSAAHALVWPSLYEGFGLPPLEAMACGTPVVTSNTSSLPEVVGDAALQVDPYDVDALADAMRAVATDAALRNDLADKGAHRAAQFTWDRTAQLTLDTYRVAARG